MEKLQGVQSLGSITSCCSGKELMLLPELAPGHTKLGIDNFDQ